jgi:haloalkane dehalogenase
VTANWRDRKSSTDVLGHEMAYIDEGEGDPIVFLHGNPTSSYLWRTVIPPLADRGRIVVPDLIGMGDSAKLPVTDPDRYTFIRHREFVDALLEQLGITENVTLVIHDWGSALGFDWARRHPEAVRGIAYMEAITQPLDSWDTWPRGVRELFQGFRSERGEDLVLRENAFVELVLPGAVVRELTGEEMAEYRRPYLQAGESRRPTLTWPRQIPIEGRPEDVCEIVEEYGRWLASTPGLPKLFINGDPGAILRHQQRDFCRTWPDQIEVTVPGIHFLQEDSGPEIGQAIADWLPPSP